MLLAVIATSFSIGVKPVGSTNATVAEPLEQAPVVENKTLYTLDELKQLTLASASKYGANHDELLNTVKCEAKQRLIDGVIYYDAKAKSDYPEESYGLAQWHLPSGNHNLEGERVTYEQATDARYSLDLMANYFAKGKKGKWSCYKKLYA